MQLYSFCHSSTSFRVRIAIELKGLDVEYRFINLRAGEQRGPDYVQKNPSAAVPLLITDDGTTLSQSLAIIEYLDAIFHSVRLIPQDPKLRAQVLEVANMIACDIHPINNLRVLGYLKNELAIDDGQRQQWYLYWATEGLKATEAALSRNGFGEYSFGDSPTLADCCLVPQMTNASRFGVDLQLYPRCLSVYQHCMRNPAFERAAAINQPDFVP